VAAQPQREDLSPITPANVAGRRFPLSRRGYDPAQVGQFLELVAERLAQLETEVREQLTRTELLERRSTSAQEAAYARIFRHLTDVVRAADEAAVSIRIEAEAEARRVAAKAREEAVRIRAQAKAEAARIVATARAETDRSASSEGIDEIDLRLDLRVLDLLEDSDRGN
jgi:DivIVA domain-containing protein